MSKSIRVKAAIADKTQITLYTEAGETIVIKQGDYRLTKVLDEIIPITSKGQIAVVDLERYNVYKDFQDSSNGIVRFFKVAKEKVKHLLGLDTNGVAAPEAVVPTSAPLSYTAPEYGVLGEDDPILSQDDGEFTQKQAALENAKQANTVFGKSDETFLIEQADETIDNTQTVVAVINGINIPGVEKIYPLISHAVKTNSTEAVQNFLKRVSKMIDQRSHSVADLMRFLEKGDLPLAADGSIIAYKVLRKRANYFVDCHTGNIPQKVGSMVRVDEALVDKNRRNECSNGLHIARRGYLSGFSGDVCVLCRIAPEDVVTVPHNDPDKIRVMGYHIIGVISDEGWSLLKANKAMTTQSADRQLLNDAINDQHINVLEYVKVHGQLGTKVEIVLPPRDYVEPRLAGIVTTPAAALDDPDHAVGNVNPKEINRRVNEELEKNQAELVELAGTMQSGTEAANAAADRIEAMLEAKAKVYVAVDFAKPGTDTTVTYVIPGKKLPNGYKHVDPAILERVRKGELSRVAAGKLAGVSEASIRRHLKM